MAQPFTAPVPTTIALDRYLTVVAAHAAIAGELSMLANATNTAYLDHGRTKARVVELEHAVADAGDLLEKAQARIAELTTQNAELTAAIAAGVVEGTPTTPEASQ